MSLTVALPSDKFLVFKSDTIVIRRCCFCNEPIEDTTDKDINFIVHCGMATPGHVRKQEWADYVTFVNRI